ncbi:tetratricopeptide repeat protein [Micromonospora sp. NPDC005257]|uniref:tetratricopeptide repeat protein n=1 Tax=Micromonospora sp. NPDC005257 TaxID=3364230 RepID=UPI0036989E0C
MSVSGSVGVQVGSNNSQVNLSLVHPRATGLVRTLHNLPPAAAVFEGRDIGALDDLFGETGAAQVVVHGLGGVGKSELANQYARTSFNRYSLLWWVTADSPQSIALGLAALTRRLHPVATLADATEWALGWLQMNSGWLLILDDVEEAADIAELLGLLAGCGDVLVTTRRDLGARWRKLGLKTLHLDVLDPLAAAHLMDELAGLDDPQGADRLARALGGLPLALELAAAYVAERGLTYGDYESALANRFDRVAGEGFDRQEALATVWSVTLAAVTHRSPLAIRVLETMSWLSSDPLPESVLESLVEDPAEVYEAVTVLASYSMVTRTSDAVAVHPLVQSVVRNSLTAEGRADEVRETAARVLLDAAPADPVNDVAGWPKWAALLPHILALTEHMPDDHLSEAVLGLRRGAGIYVQYQGNVSAAIAVFERVVADSGRILGPNHLRTLTARADLATAYQQTGRTREATAAWQQLHADCERVLGTDHPQTLTALAGLASAYQQAGSTRDAVILFERLLVHGERVLGTDHPQTLTVRANLAVSYQQEGNAEKAMEMEVGVLADRERLLGPDHPDTLTARANLAVSFWQAGRTGEAIALFEQVLADRERVLGSDHPDTLTTRANLATSYQQDGRYSEAIALLENALAGRQRILGVDHPDTLTTRANLAASYQRIGRSAEAIAQLEHVLFDSERTLGHGHPRTMTVRANLAVAYQQVGRVEEAITALEGVIADSQRVLGPENPQTLTALANLAASYQQIGREAEASALFGQVLALRERILGPDHPQTLATRNNLAMLRRPPAVSEDPEPGHG